MRNLIITFHLSQRTLEKKKKGKTTEAPISSSEFLMIEVTNSEIASWESSLSLAYFFIFFF